MGIEPTALSLGNYLSALAEPSFALREQTKTNHKQIACRQCLAFKHRMTGFGTYSPLHTHLILVCFQGQSGSHVELRLIFAYEPKGTFSH